MDNEKQHSDPPRAVKVINATAHGVMSVLVWVLAWDAQAHRGIDPKVAYGAAIALTGLGGFQLKKNQPPISALVSAGTAAIQALRHMKGSAVLAVVTGSLLISSCGQFRDPGNTAKDILFSGSKAMLKAACDNLSPDAGQGWQVGCTALQGTLSHLQQTGAGPSELPPGEARQRCVLKAGGELSCGG